MPKRRKARQDGKKEKAFEKRFEDFGDEVGALGRRFGERMEEHGKRWESRGKEWDGWFHRTLGVVGPLLSSIIGVIVLALLVWAMTFVNSHVQSWLLADISSFLTNNIAVFFVIFLFFSYTSYFSRFNRRAYRLFSPFSVAVAVMVCFWIAAHAITTANVSLGIPALSEIAFHVNQNLLAIFWLFLALGYLVLIIMIATEKTLFVAAAPGRKPSLHESRAQKQDTGTRRLYRSGNDKILGGVCGGIAEYLGVDPVIIRLLWIVGTFAWGFGIILYIFCWIVIPRNPDHKWN